MKLAHIRRFAVSLAVIACAAFPVARPSRAALGDGIEQIRDALTEYAASLPEPTNRAQRRAMEKLNRVIEALGESPADAAAEALAVAEAYADLASAVLADPAIAAALDAALAVLGPDLAAALGALEGELAQFGDPPPAAVEVIRAVAERAAEAVGDASDPELPVAQRMRALRKAGKKLADALGRLGEYEATLSECPPALWGDTVKAASATISIDGGEPFTVSEVLTSGSGSRGSADFNATIYDTPGNLRYVVRKSPLRTGVIALTADDEFTQGVFVTFQDRAVEYLADTGTFTITSISLERYPPPAQAPYKKYLRVRGTFTGSGAPRNNPADPRKSISAEFESCEIPFASN